ncbi:hypothetical protein LguiB_016545 [Lonicera macranthoides]
MAFQDFDYLSEKRRQEREQKVKKRITIGIVSAFALLLVAAVCASVYRSPENNNKPEKSSGAGHLSQSLRTIKTLCESTDYKDMCESSLKSAVKSHPSATQPTDILKLAFSVVEFEVDKVKTEVEKLKYDTPMKKAGAGVCLDVMYDAKQEINSSINSLSSMELGNLKTPELNNWLSAVMSYQETCVDALVGEAKSAVAKTLRTAEELTSNSLAIVSQVGSVLSAFHPTVATGTSVRHLLDDDDDNIPEWVSEEDRRMLKSEVPKWNPNVTVAKDGSGNFTTIVDALVTLPRYKGRYFIYVKEGIYEESILITPMMVNITMYGDGSQKTIVTGNKSYDDGVPTYLTPTFAAVGKGFMAVSMGFRNTAGPEKHQAVALRVQSDHSIFLNCRMEGYQDTLYAQTHRQFYKGCYITGSSDFIFGDAAAIFQNCMIYLKKPLDYNQENAITAQGRASKRETTGFVLHNCRILADENLEPEKKKFKSYLGRPWKKYSRTIVMESEISDVIDPEGWLPWNKTSSLESVYYGEYKNKGNGADLKRRAKFAGFMGELDKEVAMMFMLDPFIQGECWLKDANISARWGLNS